MIDIDALVRQHSVRLRRFLHRKVANQADVEEIVQETCLEAWRCRDRFHGESKPETWLFGIAVNLVRNHYKRQKVRGIFCSLDDVVVDDGEAENPMDIIARKEVCERVSVVLDGLPQELRRTFELAVDGDAGYEGAAQELNIPIGTVRSRVSRIRDKLAAVA